MNPSSSITVERGESRGVCEPQPAYPNMAGWNVSIMELSSRHCTFGVIHTLSRLTAPDDCYILDTDIDKVLLAVEQSSLDVYFNDFSERVVYES